MEVVLRYNVFLNILYPWHDEDISTSHLRVEKSSLWMLYSTWRVTLRENRLCMQQFSAFIILLLFFVLFHSNIKTRWRKPADENFNFISGDRPTKKCRRSHHQHYSHSLWIYFDSSMYKKGFCDIFTPLFVHVKDWVSQFFSQEQSCIFAFLMSPRCFYKIVTAHKVNHCQSASFHESKV